MKKNILAIIIFLLFKISIGAEMIDDLIEDTVEVVERVSSQTELVEKVPSKKKWEAEYQIPKNKNYKALWKLAVLDFFIPGYGLYTLSQNYWALGYALGRVAGFLSIYFSVDSYLFWKPLADQIVNPSSLASSRTFQVRGVGDRTAREILTTSDVSLILVMLSITFEVFLSGISILHSLTKGMKFQKEGAYYKIDLKSEDQRRVNHAIKLGYQIMF